MLSFFKRCHGRDVSSQQQNTKTEDNTREWDIAMTGLIMLLFGKIWNTFGLKTKKMVDSFKWG